MSYLIDTCAISELVRPTPSPLVLKWFDAVPSDALFISALTLGEIRKGVEKLPAGRRREHIRAWLEIDLPAWFDGRVLPVDAPVADEWGRLVATAGASIPAIDALIAATALRHRLSVVTRNAADFAGTGVPIIDPWDAA